MQKIIIKPILAGFICLICLLSATAPPPVEEEGGILITDDAGKEINLPRPAEKIVSLSPSDTEMLFAIGAAKQIVGVTDFCNYPPQALEKSKVGGYAEISIEQVAGLGPDLVIADSLHLSTIVPALENLGLKVIIITPRDIASVYTSLSILGQATGHEEETSVLIQAMEQQQQSITKAISGREKPRVFWELSGDLWTAGPGSFIDDLISNAGGINVAAGADSPWVQLSTEVIIQENPQVIFLADHPFGENIASVSSRPGWDNLDAVQAGRIIEINDVDMMSRPGPRVIQALAYIATYLHPGVVQ